MNKIEENEQKKSDKGKRIDILLICSSIFVWFLMDAEQIRRATREALTLCTQSVIPSLFPFMVVSGLLISIGFGEWVSPLFTPLMTTLFQLPGHAGSALILGLLGGYPIGARTAAELYKNKLLTHNEAQRLLTFCNNSNPAFLMSVLGIGVFKSIQAGIWLLLIHILAALIAGLIFCRSSPDNQSSPDRQSFGKEQRKIPSLPPSEVTAFFPAFVEAVGSAALAMLRVCAFVTFFYILAIPLREFEITNSLYQINNFAPILRPILTGLLELFSLTPMLTTNAFSFIIASCLSGWGGLSVMCQTAAVLEDSGLSIKSCLAGKAIQGILSAVLAAIVIQIH